MSFKITLSENAVDDMAKIRSYITYNLQNPDAALEQLERIFFAVEALKEFPKIHRVRKKDKKGNEIRVYPVDNYVIIYSINEVERIVNVSHVLYGRRNMDSIV